jgi:DNA polymerase III alpha subunit
MPDIDIDFLNRDEALNHFKHVRASRVDGAELVKHNTGIYFHSVPVNAEKNLCAMSYDQAEEFGYFKIDFLNVSMYKGVRDEEHLKELMLKEPLWDLLEQDDFVNLLFHVNGHGSILRQIKPRTVEELAAVLAVIRPAKRHLLGQSMEEILKQVWTKPTGNEYYFKKSHATAYAVAIVVQMNLICEQISYQYS